MDPWAMRLELGYSRPAKRVASKNKLKLFPLVPYRVIWQVLACRSPVAFPTFGLPAGCVTP
eukprot:scaffold9307_cov166-Amphora_coffeaeformis.AAC.4